MWHPNIEFFCMSSLFQIILNCFMVDAQRVSDVWTPCMPIYRDQLQNIIDFFSERPAGARRIFHIHIFITETFKPITHGTISYSIVAVNSTNFSACLSCVIDFFIAKKHHIVYFFRNFTHFQTFITFNTNTE